MMVYGFQNPYVSGLLHHWVVPPRASSDPRCFEFFQSLGLNNDNWTPALALGARIFAWLLFIGYTSIPVAVLLGLIQPAQQL